MSVKFTKRRTVVTLIVAVGILLAAEGTTRALADRLHDPGPWNNIELETKVEQMDALANSGGADVVFYGSSMVNVGMDPKLYEELSPPGTVVYNAGLNASSPRLIELWSREIVLPRLQPKLVVIGLSSRELNDNGINTAERYDRYVGSIGRAFTAGQPTVSQRIDRVFSNQFDLVRLRSVIRRPYDAFRQLSGTAPEGDQVNDHGAVTNLLDNDYRLNEAFSDRTINLDLVDYEVGGPELEALGRLIEEIRASGAEVLLVDMPVVADDYVPMHPNGQADADEYRESLVRFAAQHNVSLATPGNAPWPTAYFADPLHLNQSGVDKLTTMVWEVASGK